jgi:hypothetical protein
VTFKYEDRYKVKQVDRSKAVFCEDVALSKAYENMLKDFANRILEMPETFFAWRERGMFESDRRMMPAKWEIND